MEEKTPGRTRPEMGTPEYEEWRKEVLKRRRKRQLKERRKRLVHHNSGNDRRSRGISRGRCAKGQK